MPVTIRPDKHVYLQIAEDLRNKIYTKQLTHKLPGIRELAQQYSINFKTANKAISLLVEEKLLYRVQGSGTFVIDSISELQEHHLIGLIISDLHNPNFARIVQSLHKIESTKNLSVLVSTTGRQVSRIREILETYRRQNVKAIILQGGAFPDQASLELILKTNLPVIGAHTNIAGIDNVWPDVHAGAQLATDHLIENFGLEVGYISGSTQEITRTGRFLGYRDAILSKGGKIDYTLLKSNKPTYAGGYQAVKEMLEKNQIPRSIFFYNQIMAMGALNAIISSRLRIPEDIALVGCDDSVNVDEMIVPLTTIDFSYSDTANQLLGLVERRLNNPTISSESIRIAPKLITRTSSSLYSKKLNEEEALAIA